MDACQADWIHTNGPRQLTATVLSNAARVDAERRAHVGVGGRVVDQDVDRAESLDGRGNAGFGLIGLAGVGREHLEPARPASLRGSPPRTPRGRRPSATRASPPRRSRPTSRRWPCRCHRDAPVTSAAFPSTRMSIAGEIRRADPSGPDTFHGVNRLADETSPYLRQHADNPVDWYPWGDEAFARARTEDRPILLSVGYSACHWCHVMAHESFEDDATAALMNELFVNIKVDREERPDVDAIYMDAVQAMTGQGGWPMTVFLTPDGRPFFGGTYFPQGGARRHARFTDLLQAHRRRVAHPPRRPRRRRPTELTESIGAAVVARAAGRHRPGPTRCGEAYAGLAAAVRPRVGRLRRGAEVPPDDEPRPAAAGARPQRVARDAGDGHDLARRDGLRAASTTTSAAASPATRSTREWLVPHFEKMLYDQALLARVYLHAWQVTGERPLPPGARRDRRLRAPRPAPPARRLLLGRGRRLDATDVEGRSTSGRRRDPRGARRRRRRPGRSAGGASPRRATSRAAPSSTARSRGDLAAPEPIERGPRSGCSRPASDALRPGPRRQGADRVERAHARRPLAEAAAATGNA